MVQWIQALVPGEKKELADVAMVNGKPFAAIAAHRQYPWQKTKYILVLEANRSAPMLFEKLAGAKHYVEAAAIAALVEASQS